MNCEVESAEYRAKIQYGILGALKPLSLKPETERAVEAIATGTTVIPVILGMPEVDALFEAGLLHPLIAVGGDLKKDGLKDILELPPCAEASSSGNKFPLVCWRIIEYRIVAPGKIVVWNTEDVIKLKVMRIGLVNDYNWWNLSRLVVNQNGESLRSFDDDGTGVSVRSLRRNKKEYRGKIKYIRVPQTTGKGSISVLEIYVPVFDGKGDVLDKRRGQYGELLRGKDGQPIRDESGNYQAKFPGPPELTTTFPESLVGEKYIILDE